MKRQATPMEKAIRDFVKSRSPGVGGALKNVVMGNERVEDERILKELDKLKIQGMALEIVGMPVERSTPVYGYYNRPAVAEPPKDWAV